MMSPKTMTATSPLCCTQLTQGDVVHNSSPPVYPVSQNPYLNTILPNRHRWTAFKNEGTPIFGLEYIVRCYAMPEWNITTIV